VDLAGLSRLAACAARRLRMRARGRIEITFLDDRRMRGLNRRFLGHDRVTDVLSFRYGARAGTQPHDPDVVGEILIAPNRARIYAGRAGTPYRHELARYVVHGLLHWCGRRDGTARERAAMRRAEDRLLAACYRTRRHVANSELGIRNSE